MGFLILTDNNGYQSLVNDSKEDFFRAFNLKVPPNQRYTLQNFDTKEAALAAKKGSGIKKVAAVPRKTAPAKKSKSK